MTKKVSIISDSSLMNTFLVVLLDGLVACVCVEARKEIVLCSGEEIVRGTVLTPRGSRRATLVEQDMKSDKWSGRIKC